MKKNLLPALFGLLLLIIGHVPVWGQTGGFINTPAANSVIKASGQTIISNALGSGNYFLQYAENIAFTVGVVEISQASSTFIVGDNNPIADAPLKAGITYYFRTRRASGTNSTYSTYRTLRVDGSNIASPAFGASINTGSTIIVETQPVGTGAYYLQYADNPNFTGATELVNATSTSFTVGTLLPGTTYYFRSRRNSTTYPTSSIATHPTNPSHYRAYAVPGPPTIVAPAPEDAVDLSVCGFNVSVQGAGSGTRSIRVTWTNLDDASNNGSVLVPVSQVNATNPVVVPLSGTGTSAFVAGATYEIVANAYGVVSGASFNFGQSNPLYATIGAEAVYEPVITSPAEGPDAPIQPTIEVAAFAGCGTLTSAVIEIDKAPADFDNPSTDYQTKTFTTNLTGPFSWQVPTMLESATAYQIKVTFNVSGGAVYTTIQDITTVSAPIVVSPTDTQAGVNPCGFDVLVQPFSGATLYQVKYRFSSGPTDRTFYGGEPAITRDIVSQPPVAGEPPYAINIPGSVLDASEGYVLRISAGNLVDGSFVQTSGDTTIFFYTGDIPESYPVVASPSDGAVNIPINTTVSLSPFVSDCGTIKDGSVVIEIVPENLPFSSTSAGYQAVVAGLVDGTYQAAFSGLLHSTTYKIKANWVVVSLNGDETLVNNVDNNGGNFHTFTTIAPPVINYPANNATNLPTCFSVGVDAYPGAASARVLRKLTTDATYSNISQFVNSTGAFQLPVKDLEPTKSYNIRVELYSSVNGGGSLIGVNTITITTGTTVPSSSPVFIYPPTPPNNTTTPDITLNPTLRIDQFKGCGQIYNVKIEIFQGNSATGTAIPVLDTLVLGKVQPAYYQGTVNNSLLPNTIYTARATFTVENLDPANSFSTTTVFKTGNFLEETFVSEVQSPNNLVGGEYYLNSFSQILKLRLVDNANAFEVQIASSPTFDAGTIVATQQTIPGANYDKFTFSPVQFGLVSGSKYYVRAKALNTISARTGSYEGANVIAIHNSLHPMTLLRPGGPIFPTSVHSTKLVANGVVANSTSAIFQLFEDAPVGSPYHNGTFDAPVDANGNGKIEANEMKDPIVNKACTFRGGCPTITDPVDGTIGYLGDWNRLGSWTYDYVQNLTVGTTYHIRVKAIRHGAGPNGYLQAGYWYSPAQTFTVTPGRVIDKPENEVKLFPNPFINEMTMFIGEEFSNVRMRVTDVMGREIEDRPVKSGEYVNFGTTWARGVYIIQFTDDTTLSQTYRVVKQ